MFRAANTPIFPGAISFRNTVGANLRKCKFTSCKDDKDDALPLSLPSPNVKKKLEFYPPFLSGDFKKSPLKNRTYKGVANKFMGALLETQNFPNEEILQVL